MSRIPPAFPSDLPNLNAPPSSWTVALRTVTPMFGGAATERQVDARHPIRPASVRGHLRFWWRATSGAGFTTAEQLFDAESALWGNTKTPGQVRVQVRVTDAGQQVRPIRHERRSNGKMMPDFGNYPAYALFPFQGTIKWGEIEKAPDDARENVVFSVTLTRLELSDEQWAQVRTALNAWVLFGGIGSRTRRGCGSLELVEGEATAPQPRELQEKLARMLTTLPGRYYVGSAQKDAVAAWTEAVAVYRDFRQGVDFARNEGQQKNRPGRSRYPEPDTLRDLTRRYGHDVIHPVRGFPRADLGLPIIFHFQGQGEPSDQTLQGRVPGKQRFASPVITKAARIDGQYVPLVMVLDSPHVWEGPGVEIKGQGEIRPEQMNLSPEKRRQIRPLNGLPVRDALAHFVQSRKFTEVTL